jgi:hypothetical protein
VLYKDCVHELISLLNLLQGPCSSNNDAPRLKWTDRNSLTITDLFARASAFAGLWAQADRPVYDVPY